MAILCHPNTLWKVNNNHENVEEKRDGACRHIYTGLVGGRQVDLITRVIFCCCCSLLLFLVGFFCLTVGGSLWLYLFFSLFRIYIYIFHFIYWWPLSAKMARSQLREQVCSIENNGQRNKLADTLTIYIYIQEREIANMLGDWSTELNSLIAPFLSV